MNLGHSAASGAKRPLNPWNGIQLRYTARSDVGIVREKNEDSYLAEPSIGLFIVADGMGGAAGGEVASSRAIETLKKEISHRFRELHTTSVQNREILMRQAVNNACLDIYSLALEHPQLRGMGTTATTLWLPKKTLQSPQSAALLQSNQPSRACVAHVGDSRCYMLRAGLLYQLTNDHSLYQEKVIAGVLQPDSPSAHQLKCLITRCVGDKEEEEVDIVHFEPFRGDRFLLCSDGLSNKITEKEMADLMMEDDLQWVADHMIELAKERGGEDNITVLLIALDT